MKGYQITFFTRQDRHHDGKPIAQWLIDLARSKGLRGATSFAGVESFGRDGHIHSARFIELADQPIQVTMTVTDAELAALFSAIDATGLELFFVKQEIEFGVTGKAADSTP